MRTSILTHTRQTAPCEQGKAFTLVELLVVLAIVGLLVCIAVPALAGVKGQTKTAHCVSNLRQFTLAMLTYGQENNDKLPQFNGSWAWDVPTVFITELSKYGARREHMYCPAFPEQNYDGHWNFTTDWRILGYVLTLPGPSGALSLQWQNPTIVPQTIVSGATQFAPQPASQRVLVADVVVNGGPGPSGNSTNYATMLTYDWYDVVGGSAVHHRSSHIVGRIPAGGNLGMLDGHVEWREFRAMRPRFGGPPYWYW
jgi:prepilin-type N-terminal cleavage/methylation domain-containing protein/prepilin-type processing-associated H-X9-DG protein